VQQHNETFAASVAGLPQIIKDEFEAFLECGILDAEYQTLREIFVESGVTRQLRDKVCTKDRYATMAPRDFL
jgi:hypothetical protein